jgi:hypothetical protein
MASAVRSLMQDRGNLECIRAYTVENHMVLNVPGSEPILQIVTRYADLRMIAQSLEAARQR